MTRGMIQRTVTGVLLIAMVSVAVYMGGWVFAVICMACICLAMYEEYHALSLAGHRPVQWPVWVCMVVSIPAILLTNNQTLVVLLAATCFLVSLIIIFRHDPKVEDILFSLMPLFSVLLPGMCLLGLLSVSPKGVQVTLYCLSFGVPVAGDTLAYFIGSRIGRTKLCPAVSPNKTVAGAVAGMAGSLAAAMIVFGVSSIWIKTLPPWWHFVVLGVAGGFTGQIGDLFASLVKRHCGIKDFGHIFPGHGGMLDRLDSIFFTTVVIYVYWLMVFVQ